MEGQQEEEARVRDQEPQTAQRQTLPSQGQASAPAGEQREPDHLKPPEKLRKYVPVILMLLGGAAGSVTAYLLQYEMNLFLGITLVCLVLFYLIGNLFVLMLDRFDDQIEKAGMDTGKVIEKEGEEGASSEAEQNPGREG